MHELKQAFRPTRCNLKNSASFVIGCENCISMFKQNYDQKNSAKYVDIYIHESDTDIFLLQI